jgi:probable rRNA maturation factor
MIPASSTVPVTIELQDAIGGTGLPDEEEWARWVTTALVGARNGTGFDTELGGTVTVRLVGDDESGQLNSTYRNKSGATNVLAFSGTGEGAAVPDEDRELGDIVICLPVVYREAKDQGKSPTAHMAHMTVHGTLHLLGFDHEDGMAARRMESLETQILDGLGFPDPYQTI